MKIYFDSPHAQKEILVRAAVQGRGGDGARFARFLLNDIAVHPAAHRADYGHIYDGFGREYCYLVKENR